MLKKKILGAKVLDTNGYVLATRLITPTNNESEAADVKRLFNQGTSKPAHLIGDIYNANMVDVIARAVSQGDPQLNDLVNAEVEARKVEDKKLGDRIAALDGKITAEQTRAANAENALDGRVDTLEEAVGTGGSVDSRIASAVATETSRAQEAEANRYTKNETYTKEEVNNLITTPNQKYISVTATKQTTVVTDVLPATGAENTIYRVGNWDGSQYDTTCYTEYTWNGSIYVLLNTKEYGIDDEPTAGSNNLVKSKGVYEAIAAKSEMPLVDEEGFHVVDENLNVGVKYDEAGLDAAKVHSHFIEVLKAAGVSDDDVMTSHATEVNEDGFFIADESLNVGIKVDSDGIHAKNILEYEIAEN